MLAKTSAKAKGFLPWIFTKNPTKSSSKQSNNSSTRGEEADDEDDYGASLKEFTRAGQQHNRKDKKTIILEKILKGIEVGAIGAIGSLIGVKLVLGASPRAQRFIVNQISERLVKKHAPDFDFMYGEVHYNPIFNKLSFKNGSIMVKTPCRIPKTYNYTLFIHFEKVEFTLPFVLSLMTRMSTNLFQGIYIKGANVFLDLRNIHRPLPTLSQQQQYYHSQKSLSENQQSLSGEKVRSSSSNSANSSSNSANSASATGKRLNTRSSPTSSAGDSEDSSDDDSNGPDGDDSKDAGMFKGLLTGKVKNVKIEDSHAIILTKNQKKK